MRQEKELDPTTYYYLVEDLQTDYEYDFWVKASTIAGQGESSRIATEIPMSRGKIFFKNMHEDGWNFKFLVIKIYIIVFFYSNSLNNYFKKSFHNYESL